MLLVGCVLVGWMAVSRGGFISYYILGCLLVIMLTAVCLQWFSLLRLQAQRKVLNAVGTAGDEMFVKVQVTFRSLLPLVWLVWRETWKHEESGELLQYSTLQFPWFQRSLAIGYKIRGLRRGKYSWVSGEAVTGDLFGFAVNKRKASAEHAVHSFKVYPKPAEISRIAIPLASGDGAAAQQRRQLDWAPAHAVGGIREYVSGDSQQRIHWKSTARLGRLITKEAERSSAAKCMLLLDAAPAFPPGSAGAAASQPLLEQGIALAAAFFEAAAAARESCGFASSSASAQRIAPAIRQDPTLAYEVLASVGGNAAEAFPDLVRKEAAALPPDTSMLCITSTLGPALLHALAEARSRRRSVHVVYVHAGLALSPAEREGVAQLQALGCSCSAAPHPRSEWPKREVIVDADA
ncbi:DUF58 domain-containing protein [Paenibacillus eucommiae]|uniref:Uncharacterized protein (DUF58 family) n=1 Tax=Paenibacillus eucommiae TaxID=1355755 RepID=A0ABS4IXP1_9BACL|nr:DUF58 domain-containing protein [Paenibacillus eucommiae]MBP1992278.1 uncharacterized protein (DUF58 family) [Paenibacillus eucommiae]